MDGDSFALCLTLAKINPGPWGCVAPATAASFHFHVFGVFLRNLIGPGLTFQTAALFLPLPPPRTWRVPRAQSRAVPFRCPRHWGVGFLRCTRMHSGSSRESLEGFPLGLQSFEQGQMVSAHQVLRHRWSPGGRGTGCVLGRDPCYVISPHIDTYVEGHGIILRFFC